MTAILITFHWQLYMRLAEESQHHPMTLTLLMNRQVFLCSQMGVQIGANGTLLFGRGLTFFANHGPHLG